MSARRRKGGAARPVPGAELVPVVLDHAGIAVVRDDLFPGGTKARFAGELFAGADEVVYASPAEGGAQYALAVAAFALRKRVTIFVARRAEPHPRVLEARALAAKIVQITPGYLSVVQARAAAYAAAVGARLAPFGLDTPDAVRAIAKAARAAPGPPPDEVWCAAGSGTLARGLALAWPGARRYAVQVGRQLAPADVAGAEIIVYPRPFGWASPLATPFPADPHYDAKAWEVATARRGAGRVLFWNVTGPAAAGVAS